MPKAIFCDEVHTPDDHDGHPDHLGPHREFVDDFAEDYRDHLRLLSHKQSFTKTKVLQFPIMSRITLINRIILIASAIGVLISTIAWLRPLKQKEQPVREAYMEKSDSVDFDISPILDQTGQLKWLATYTSQGRTAQFRIELGPQKHVAAKGSDDFSFSTGEGRFVAEPGSDSSVLLADLKNALEATSVPRNVQRSESIPFTFVVIGEQLSQARGGGFNAEPAGNWKTIKLFFGKGKQEAEVFLNINSVIGKGQFSMKDPDYGDLVIAQLARVL